jgi:acetyl esterase/lipase
MLVHGGYWRSHWTLDLMDPMAEDLTARGFATWNVEYRRPDRHGWDATTADLGAALAALADVDVDLSRIVLIGHSAGGQLVLRLAADAVAAKTAVQPAYAVSLAGVLDLKVGDERWLSDGAVSMALGGRYAQVPARYAASSPIQRLPLGVPHLVVCCRQDELLDLSRGYAAAAGAEATYLEEDGDHFDVIRPDTDIWHRTAEAVTAALY